MEQGPRRSVAELAGRFKCQNPLPSAEEGNKPVRRRPPRTLQIPINNEGQSQGQDEKKAELAPQPTRKNRNSALIEKLQADLALSPVVPMLSPMSPGAKKSPSSPFKPQSPCSPLSPPVTTKPSAKETPASFETPAEGTVLLSVNKSRARHSIKRRPPSRRLRKSSGDDGGTEDEKMSSEQTASDGKENDVFEKQTIEETDSTTHVQEDEQIQVEETPPSEQQPEKEKEESSEASEVTEKMQNVENMEEEKTDLPLEETTTSEGSKQELDEASAPEPQTESNTVSDNNQDQKMEEKEEEKEEAKDTQMEECKNSDE